MKTTHTLRHLILAIFVFTMPLVAETSLLDDGPPGFVHLREEFGGGAARDVYLNANQIVSVQVTNAAASKGGKPTVTITTTAIAPEMYGREGAASRSVSHAVQYGSQQAADAAAKRIMAIAAGPAK